jgi:hypothetical protein
MPSKFGSTWAPVQDLRNPKTPQEQERYDQPAPEGQSKFNVKWTPVEEDPTEPTSSKLGRGAGRTIARSAETLLGLPGDLQNFVESLLGRALGLAVGDERGQQLASQARQLGSKVNPFAYLPSSRDFRENLTQPITGTKLEPQTPGEELYDEIVSDFAALALPVKGKIPFARALGMSLFPNLGKEAVKSYGGSETTQAGTKLGLMFLSGALGHGGARNYVNELQRDARALIPEGATTNARDLLTDLEKFEATLRKGGISPQKQPALSLNRQLMSKIRQGGGELAVEELPEFRKSINDYRFNKDLSDTGRFFLDRFDDVINKELLEYGKTNPAFLNKYRDANLGFAGFKQSNRIANYISKKFDVTKLSPESYLLLGLHALSPKALTGIGASALAAKGAQVFNRIAKNPVLRQYYLNVVNNALKDNSAGMVKNLEKLDEELRKSNDASR